MVEKLEKIVFEKKRSLDELWMKLNEAKSKETFKTNKQYVVKIYACQGGGCHNK